MITLDVTRYGKKLTLEKLVELYDDTVQMLSPHPVKLGIKERVEVRPDQLKVTAQQWDLFFSGADGRWKQWRHLTIVMH